MEEIEKRLNQIPEWFINLLSVLSSLIGILTPIIGFFKIKRNIQAGIISDISTQLLFIFTCVFVSLMILMLLRVRKYRKLLMLARKSMSEDIYKFLHDFRNLYFSLTKSHKNKEDSITILTNEVRKYMEDSLDYLCDTLNSFTRKKICGCIKIIETEKGKLSNNIKLEEATIRTFARSRNTDYNRGRNDKSKIGPKLIDNTDFFEIIDPSEENSMPYFYKRDLVRYQKELDNIGKTYKNTTSNWQKYYRGTIVAPIRIAREHLYYTEDDGYYDILGFLCVDSMSTRAFLKNQERFNCSIVKAYAAEMYVVLSKYRYYLQQIYERNGKNEGDRKGDDYGEIS